MDVPSNGAVAKTVASVMGWAVADEGISNVGIYLDQGYIMDATLHLARPDVKAVFPQIPDAENSGWEADLKLDSISPGPHVITASVRAKNGAISTYSAQITVQQ